MFSHMEGTLMVAGLIAGIVFIAAFAAEGRGERALRILLGVERRRRVREHLFDELERPSATLDVVSRLGKDQTGEIDLVAARSAAR